METFALMLSLPAAVVGGLALLFRLSRVGSPEWVRRIAGGPRARRFNLWHMMAAVIVTGLLLVALTAPPGEEKGFAAVLLSLGILAWFVRSWCNEFVFLMGLRDEDFPGRNDKLIWAVVLLAFAPISVWLFRTFRAAQWPQTKFVSVDYSEFREEPGTGTAAQPA
jgi:uncharacterized membrane protein YhaH (DUF805 family)